MVLATKTNYGARRFAVAGPLTWNILPQYMRSMYCGKMFNRRISINIEFQSIEEFKSILKLHIFKKAYSI